MAWKTLTALTLGPRARGQFNKLTDKWLMSERISSIEALACQSCNHDGFFFGSGRTCHGKILTYSSSWSVNCQRNSGS